MKITQKEAIKQTGHLVDIWMPFKIKYDCNPGISIGITHKGKLLYAKGFGFADLKKNVKTDDKTLYRIASHSKMFTAVSILQLVEVGKLRLDDKVADYIPWFKAKTAKSDAKYITIRQLLSHTAGIFRDGDTPQWETGDFPKDLKKSFSSKSLVIENLTDFKYTNYGYSLLGPIIEKASDMPYADYVRANILKPLGMKNTYVDYHPGIAHIATGYGPVIPDEKRKIFGHYVTKAYAPAAGFISNLSDMTKFIAAISPIASSSRILHKESRKEMSRPHGKTGDNDEYGLGLDIDYADGSKTIGHGGGFDGFLTRTVLDIKTDIGVMVYANSLGINPSSIAFGILDAARKILNNNGQTVKTVPFKKYEGIYRDNWGDEIVVRAGQTLAGFTAKNDKPLRWARRFMPSKTKDTFVIKSDNKYGSYDEEAVFKDIRNGKANILLISGSSSRRVR